MKRFKFYSILGGFVLAISASLISKANDTFVAFTTAVPIGPNVRFVGNFTTIAAHGSQGYLVTVTGGTMTYYFLYTKVNKVKSAYRS